MSEIINTTENSTTEKSISSNRKVRQGLVVSNKMQKSIVVRVERKVKHPLYHKYLKQSKSLWLMMKTIFVQLEIL